jgi:hypothetical protein
VGQICCVIVGILLNITGNFNKAIIDCLEKIQLRFCKLLLKLKSSTPKYMIYGDLGRFSIGIDIKIKIVSFWARLFGERNKLLYTLSTEENVHLVWIKYLKELFDETGNSSIGINQDIPNSNWLISSINK